MPPPAIEVDSTFSMCNSDIILYYSVRYIIVYANVPHIVYCMLILCVYTYCRRLFSTMVKIIIVRVSVVDYFGWWPGPVDYTLCMCNTMLESDISAIEYYG